jgi:hypothetical protein
MIRCSRWSDADRLDFPSQPFSPALHKLGKGSMKWGCGGNEWQIQSRASSNYRGWNGRRFTTQKAHTGGKGHDHGFMAYVRHLPWHLPWRWSWASVRTKGALGCCRRLTGTRPACLQSGFAGCRVMGRLGTPENTSKEIVPRQIQEPKGPGI